MLYNFVNLYKMEIVIIGCVKRLFVRPSVLIRACVILMVTDLLSSARLEVTTQAGICVVLRTEVVCRMD